MNDNLHNIITKNVINDMYRNINKYATMINNENDFIPTGEKIMLAFLNYNTWNSPLGEPVICDGTIMSLNLSINYNYKCYYCCNTSASIAKQLISKAVSYKCKRCVIYYSGHGSQIKDYNGDENDGYDECWCFGKNGKREALIDDEIVEIINNNMKCEKLTCISDSCHSGTIWDVQKIRKDLKNRIICISSCNDNECSYQLGDNGIFTTYFWKCYDMHTNTININKLKELLGPNKLLHQTVNYYNNSNDNTLF